MSAHVPCGLAAVLARGHGPLGSQSTGRVRGGVLPPKWNVSPRATVEPVEARELAGDPEQRTGEGDEATAPLRSVTAAALGVRGTQLRALNDAHQPSAFTE